MLQASNYYDQLQSIKKKLDDVETPHISNIKEIINHMFFCDIISPQQVSDNRGNAYYKAFLKGEGATYPNVMLNYTIVPKLSGLAYGYIETKKKNGEEIKHFKYTTFTNYARFLADVVAKKVIYSQKLEHFIVVEKHTYTLIENATDFYNLYYVESRHKINDFLEVMESIFKSDADYRHPYDIRPFVIAGKDWQLDATTGAITDTKPKKHELFFQYYAVPFKAIDVTKAMDYIEMVSGNPASFHNLSLLHAYVFTRKMKIVPPERWFILKDFGRTGKGLFLKTFEPICRVHKIEFENLFSGGIEASNEWANFYGADVAHANETMGITDKHMRMIRKIASGETVNGRYIGSDSFKFKVDSVLILDTNENVDIGEMTANTARTVKIALKDRPESETRQERYRLFSPYWHFITDEETATIAGLSFLVASFMYFKNQGGVFDFKETTLRAYYSADQLTETQKIMLEVIHRQGFVLSGDETLQQAIKEDYRNLRTERAQRDVKAIGVATNKPKKIDGTVYKVNRIENGELFEQAYTLLKQAQTGTKKVTEQITEPENW